MTTRRIAYLVSGRVQGVGFRASARQAASRCGVTGYVRNRADGAVDGEAQGSRDEVDAFVAWLREGPPWARVEDVLVEDVPAVLDEGGFDVRR